MRRYSTQSGLRDMMIAEKEIVLTFLLQLLSERRILDRLAFKGGTCLRKMFIGSHARFSTDLDFTALGEHDHEDKSHGRADGVVVVIIDSIAKDSVKWDNAMDMDTPRGTFVKTKT